MQALQYLFLDWHRQSPVCIDEQNRLHSVSCANNVYFFSLDIPKLLNVDKPININARNSTYFIISKNNK